MTTTVRLNDSIVNDAKIHAKVENRTTAKQIEYWAKIGKIALENPDLPVPFIIDTLVALEEVKEGKATPFKFE